MAYTVPTAAEFKTRHPRFASVADGTVTIYLAEASAQVGSNWADADGPAGIMYLAAHLMTLEGALAPTKTAPGVGNQVKKVKAGEVETEFATDGAKVGYDANIYGQRYAELAARNGGLGPSSAAVAVV